MAVSLRDGVERGGGNLGVGGRAHGGGGGDSDASSSDNGSSSPSSVHNSNRSYPSSVGGGPSQSLPSFAPSSFWSMDAMKGDLQKSTLIKIEERSPEKILIENKTCVGLCVR